MGVSVGHSPMIVNGTKDPLRMECVLAPSIRKDRGRLRFKNEREKENLRLRRDERCLKSVELTDGGANRWQANRSQGLTDSRANRW